MRLSIEVADACAAPEWRGRICVRKRTARNYEVCGWTTAIAVTNRDDKTDAGIRNKLTCNPIDNDRG